MTDGSLIPNIKSNKEISKPNSDDGFTTSAMRFINTIIKVLKSSKGRNKLCALIQYISKFSAACIIYTIDTNEIKSTLTNIEMIYDRHSNLKRVEKSMSNGRKIFGFMKFFEDFKKFYSYLYDSSFDFSTILKAFTTLFACFQHFLDNLVWASNVGMLNRIISGELGWKTFKNFFNLLKTTIKLLTNLMEFKFYYYNSWINNENEIKNENYEKILNETFKNRSKLREITMDIIQSILKIMKLIFSLKLEPLYSYLHPIIISLCNVVNCIISLIKIFIKTDEDQKKMMKYFRGSFDNTSTTNITGLGVFSSNQYNKPSSLNPIARCRRSSIFELSLVERAPNHKIFDENYFDNYYIDFNKDFPLVPEMVLKANGAEYSTFTD